MTKLETYNLIVDGLTQDDIAFRDAIQELDARSDFYTMKTGAMNKFNHALVGDAMSDERPIEVVGLVDFDKNYLVLGEWYGERVYSLDELNPRYLARLNDVRSLTGNTVNRYPLSALAAELLDDEFKDVEDKPDLSKLKAEPVELNTRSRKILNQAFANEMLLLVQLDDFVQDNNLEEITDVNRHELINLVGTHGYDFRFNDAVEDLQEQIVDKYVPNLSK